MKDFTLTTYRKLLNSLKKQNYSFHTLQDFIKSFTSSPTHLVTLSPCHPINSPLIILRHDVDRKPQNALKMAELEAEMSIKASYYFRIPKTFKPEIIKQIANLGHEIGYHYENLSFLSKRKDFRKLKTPQNPKLKNEFFKAALKDFEEKLNKLRELYPVKTICMHGSPLSKWDNRDLWKKYDYRDFGIIAEPYFDIDFNEVFYITDTGRHWNNKGISVRDKVKSDFDIKIKNTEHMLNLIQSNQLPDKIMINIHPQRWFDFGFNWYWELISQNLKNVIKSIIVRSHNNE